MDAQETVTVYIEAQDIEVECEPLDTINSAAYEQHGLKLPTSCDVGACTSCTYRLLDEDGEPVDGLTRPGANTLTGGERDQGYVLTCIDRFPPATDDPDSFPGDWYDEYGDQTLTLERAFPPTTPADVAAESTADAAAAAEEEFAF